MEVPYVLDNLSARLTGEVNVPLSELSKTLETPLSDWLSQTAIGLEVYGGRRLNRFNYWDQSEGKLLS